MDELNPESTELPRIPELPEYELVRELGRGGTAVVYLARDRELSRDVAIKLIRPSYVKDEDAVARLEREAHTVGRLQHPNIAMLLGTRRLGDRGLALILQYVPGETLKERIEREGPLPFDEVERILRDLGQALAYAHRQRIVHRDIKPQNVYLDEASGVARLADFGIARAWDSDSALTLPGTAIGTPTYMAPEQVDGDRVDGKSDIYSLGLVGYEMVTGKEPWAGESLYSIIAKQKHEALPSLAEERPGVPENLQATIETALRKDPKDRWPNAEAFLSRLASGSTLAPWEPRGGVRRGGAGAMRPHDGGERRSSGASGEAVGPAAPPAGRNGRRTALLTAAGLAALAAFLFIGNVGDLRGRTDAALTGLLETVFPLPEEAPGTAPPEEPLQELAGAEPPPTDEVTSPFAPEDGIPDGVRLLPLGGTNREGRADATLAEPLRVQVLGPDGDPVSGVPVRFEVVAGEGVVGPAEALSNPDGIALTLWTLGPSELPQRVRAFVEEGLEEGVEFQARPMPPLPARVELTGGGEQVGPVGGELPREIELRVWDEDGLPLPGAEVLVQVQSGGGQVSPSTVRSDALGSARVRWTLGPAEGAQEIVATVSGNAGVRTVVNARAERSSLPVRTGTVAGGTHSCRLTGAGEIFCWGDNANGQLGDGSFSSRLVPGTPVSGSGGFAMVAAGLSHTCALDGDGLAHCWGQNGAGQLGDGSSTRRAVPTPVAGGHRFIAISAGAGHSCGLRQDGAAFCWGDNAEGQLGDGTRAARSSPTRVLPDVAFQRIVAGWNHTCGLDQAGRAYCWGTNASGESGVADAASVLLPSAVAGGQLFQEISAGGSHSCGLTPGGEVLCWGSNAFGQLGDGGGESRPTPAPVQASESFAAVTSGGVHSCALTREGTAFCWGRNHFGQLGGGGLQDRSEPTRVAGTLRFSALWALGSHTCGRTQAGEEFCWGYNIGGQLGDGSRENRSTPVRVFNSGG